MSKSTALILSVTIVSSLLLAACQPQSSSTPPSPTPAAQEEMMNDKMVPSDSPESMMKAAKEVSTTEKYQTPAGEEQVGFTIGLDDTGAITEVKTEILGKAPASKIRQEAFAKDITSSVQGKKLADLTSIDRVGGSSLTTGAFNTALDALKAQL
jgi:hypothetical protein